jgi:hypothetical protein
MFAPCRPVTAGEGFSLIHVALELPARMSFYPAAAALCLTPRGVAIYDKRLAGPSLALPPIVRPDLPKRSFLPMTFL